jgi:hypothetical protein
MPAEWSLMTRSPATPRHTHHRARRLAWGATLALGLASAACGDDVDPQDQPPESVFGTTAQVDNSAVGNAPQEPADMGSVVPSGPSQTTP